METTRLFRFVLAVLFLAILGICVSQGDSITAVLAGVGAGFAFLGAIGLRDQDRGNQWRNAEPWGRVRLDAVLVALLLFNAGSAILN
jgi:hypothetical protein